MKKKNTDIANLQNANVMADLISDDRTTEDLRVTIITKILESKEGQNFFKTMFEEGLSFGGCPECGHENHWAIPEDSLNQMGWVTSELDSRVLVNTTIEDCPEFQQACAKKRITT